MTKNIVFVGAGRITECIVENLFNTSDDVFSDSLKLYFIDYPNPLGTFPLKGLIETYKTSAIAKGKTLTSKIITEEDSFSFQADPLNKADFIVFTAALFPSIEELARARKAGLGREAQLTKNIPIIQSYAHEIKQRTKENIPIIITTNPVDVVSEYFRKLLNEKYLLLGLGGGVDTARLKYLLSKEFEVSSNEIDGFVGFLHNNSMSPLINTIKIKKQPLKQYALSKKRWDDLIKQLRNFGSTVSELSQKYKNVNAGDANTPAAVITHTILSFLGHEEQIVSYNFKSPHDKTGFQQPIKIQKNHIDLYDAVDYTEEEKQLIQQIYQKITQEIQSIEKIRSSSN